VNTEGAKPQKIIFKVKGKTSLFTKRKMILPQIIIIGPSLFTFHSIRIVIRLPGSLQAGYSGPQSLPHAA